MKGKIKLILFSSLLAFGTLTGCGNSSDNNGDGSSDDGGNNNPIDAISGLDYRVDEAQNKLKQLGSTQGFEITLEAISQEDDGTTSKDSATIGFKVETAWLAGEGAYVMTRNGTETYAYTATSGQYDYVATIDGKYFDDYITTITSMFYIAYSYNSYLDKVGPTTFLGRPATEYKFAGSYATAFANLEIIIDDETGITLKYAGKAQDLDGNAAAGSLVVTAFKTGDAVVRPVLNKNGGGSGDVTGDVFSNKKVVVTDVSAANDDLKAKVLSKYGRAYISLFADGTFEMVNPVNNTYDVAMGTFTIAADGVSAALNVTKLFDGEHQAYSTKITDEMKGLVLTYDSTSTDYSLRMAGLAKDGSAVEFTLILGASNDRPTHVDLPAEQGGEGGQGGGQGEGGEGGDPSVTLPTAGKYSLDATQVRDPGNYANGYFEIGEDGSGVFCDYVGHQYIGTFVNDGLDIVMTATSEAYIPADGTAPRTAACNKTFYFDFLGDASWGIWLDSYHLIYKYDQGQGGETPTDNLEDALITSAQYASLVTGMAYIGAEGNAKFNVQEKYYNQLYSNSTLENDNGNYQHGITYADSTAASVLFYAKYSAQAGYYDLYERQADFTWKKSANGPYAYEDQIFAEFAGLQLLSYVPFNSLSEPHFETSPYYSCASFEYEDDDSGLSIDLTNIKIYFNKGKLVHFSYTSNGYINIDVYVTDIGSVELQLPEEGGQPQEQAVQCNALISGTTGATFVYNRVDMGGYTGSSFDTTIEALQHTSFKFFADGTAETYYNPGNIEVVNVGSFTLMKKASENVGDLTLRTTTRYVNGVVESNTNTQHFAYYAQQDELHIVQTGTQGGNPVEVHLILTRDTAVPEHYQPGGQGGGEDPAESNWPAKEIENALKSIDFGSEVIPAISDPTKLTQKGSVNVVGKTAVITLNFAKGGSDALLVFYGYMTTLEDVAEYTMDYTLTDLDNNLAVYNSKSGKMSLYITLDEANGTITITAQAKAAVSSPYPGEDIADFVRNTLGATTDQLPELTIDGASYFFSDGYLSITLPADVSNASAKSVLVGKLRGFTYNELVDGYVSPNEEILVLIFDSTEGYISITLDDCENVPDVNLNDSYPSNEINAFFSGLTDQLPQLLVTDAQYDFFDVDEFQSIDGLAGLMIYLPEGGDSAAAIRNLVALLTNETNGFKDGGIVEGHTIYVSANEEIGIQFYDCTTFIGINLFNLDVYDISGGEDPTDTYPTEGIEGYLDSINAMDNLPDLHVLGATYQGAQSGDDYQILVTAPDGMSNAELIRQLQGLLTSGDDAMFYHEDYYNSPHGDFDATVFESEGGVVVALRKDGYANVYPADRIDAFISQNCPNDSFPDFSIENAIYWIDFDATYIEIELSSGSYESAVDSLIEMLTGETYGYGLKDVYYGDDHYGEMYVSPNREIGICFDDSYGRIVFVEVFILSDLHRMTVDYTFTAEDDGIYKDDPVFYAWVWGGDTYGDGRWVALSYNAQDGVFYLENIADDAEGIIIVRMSTAPTDMEVWDASLDGIVWNQTEAIDLTGNQTSFTFHFSGWGD